MAERVSEGMRARPRQTERRTRGKARGKELLHFQVQECRFDKRLGFLFFSKEGLWKALFQAWTERGIRQRHSEWKTQTFLYTSCAFTCQSAAIKLLPHGQYAKVLNSKGLKGCLWKSSHHSGCVSLLRGNNFSQITLNIYMCTHLWYSVSSSIPHTI